MKTRTIFIVFIALFMTVNAFAQGTVQEIDRNGDGVSDTKIYYDESGMPLNFEVDKDQDGRKDIWGDFNKGLLFKAYIDKDDDLVADVWVIYNPDGTTDYECVDKNGDNEPDVWVYFKENKLDRQEADKNFDGKVDLKVFYARGSISGMKQDADFDGTWEKTVGDVPADEEDR